LSPFTAEIEVGERGPQHLADENLKTLPPEKRGTLPGASPRSQSRGRVLFREIFEESNLKGKAAPAKPSRRGVIPFAGERPQSHDARSKGKGSNPKKGGGKTYGLLTEGKKGKSPSCPIL